MVFAYFILDEVLGGIDNKASEGICQHIHGFDSEMPKEGQIFEDHLADFVEVFLLELVGDFLHQFVSVLKLKKLLQIVFKLDIAMYLFLEERVDGSFIIHPSKNCKFLFDGLVSLSHLHHDCADQVNVIDQHN